VNGHDEFTNRALLQMLEGHAQYTCVPLISLRTGEVFWLRSIMGNVAAAVAERRE